MILESVLPIVFFIPGYYGSHLTRVQDSKQIFLGTPNLVPNRPLEKLDALEYQTEVMESVKIGPFSTPVYAPVLDKLRSKFGRDRIIPLSYDWRAPLDQSADKLNLFIEKSWDKKSPIIIIAHSMGGLLYSHLWKKANAAHSPWLLHLKQVTIVASPLRGSAPILRNLTIGTPFPYNATLLIPENLWTYATPFHLLPETIPVREGTTEKDLSARDPEFWKRYILPRLSFSVSDELLHKKISYMINTRTAVNELFTAKQNYKMKIIVAENQKTPARFFLDSSGIVFDQYRIFGLMFKKWEPAYYAMGDGTCTTDSQLPPETFTPAATSGAASSSSNPLSAIDLGSQNPNLSIIHVTADHMKVLESDAALSF